MSRSPLSRLAAVVVVAALTALAGLAGLAGKATLDRAEGWRARLAGEMTVALRPSAAADADAARAAEVLAGTPGVAEARALDRARVGALLAPWTAGARGPDLAALPRLIAIDLDLRQPARRQDLEAALNAAGINAIVDDHQGWRRAALELRQRTAAPLVGALMLCAAGLAAAGAMAASQEAGRREAGLRIRLRLGATPLSCLASVARALALDLGLGALAGGAVAAGLARASGLPGEGSPVVLAGVLAAVTGAALVVAWTCAAAIAARRIRELES
ncbi:MAG: hypothetical protein ACKN9P_10650 [Phenylobacterium sp.]